MSGNATYQAFERNDVRCRRLGRCDCRDQNALVVGVSAVVTPNDMPVALGVAQRAHPTVLMAFHRWCLGCWIDADGHSD